MRTRVRYMAVALVVLLGLVGLGTFVIEPALSAQGRLGGRIGEIIRQRRQPRPAGDAEKVKVGGLDVAVWRPEASGAAPLIVFSHGFSGCNTQSLFLMEALADAGYLVVAPNHKDAQCEGRGRGRGLERPEEPFRNAESWNDNTHRDRQQDMATLVQALRRDRSWNINWSRVGLVGHSLGGYTVLGLAGAWPSWRMNDVDAVLALSPYCEPFTFDDGRLDRIRIPVMYQGGTRDRGITPSVKKKGGCFDKTSSPAVFVEFDGAGHFAWSELVTQQRDAIVKYSVDFLDKYVRGNSRANPTARMAGVSDLKVK